MDTVERAAGHVKGSEGTIVRLVGMTVATPTGAVGELLTNRAHDLTGNTFVTVTRHRILIRK